MYNILRRLTRKQLRTIAKIHNCPRGRDKEDCVDLLTEWATGLNNSDLFALLSDVVEALGMNILIKP